MRLTKTHTTPALDSVAGRPAVGHQAGQFLVAIHNIEVEHVPFPKVSEEA